jgi:CHAD domain-containing protein
LEREEKFEVDRNWELPDVAELVPEGGRVIEVVHHLESTYFDTAERRLLEFGVTLRRRVGGGETGWQLKVPAGSARTELQSKSTRPTIPKDLSGAVAGLRGDRELLPVASVSTTRTARRVVDADGEVLFEIADDDVATTTLGEGAVTRAWREVEVELGPSGRKKTLAKVAAWLQAAGARPSRSATKLGRALGVNGSTNKNGHDAGDKRVTKGTVGALVLAYVGEQCAVIVSNDVALRTATPPVHKTRVAVRRLRSTLRVFADVFDAEPAAALDVELTWYAGLLGAVRDCDVLAARLADHIAALPAEYVLGPVAARVQETLGLDRRDAAKALDQGMSTERYQQLLNSLRQWRNAPPLTKTATAKAGKASSYVGKARKKADKRLDRAGGDVEELHRARKAIKRLRYAGELAKPVDSKAARIAGKAKHLQTELGEHQDAVVSAAFLARLGATAGTRPGDNGFTYGVLMANELSTAERIRRSLAT